MDFVFLRPLAHNSNSDGSTLMPLFGTSFLYHSHKIQIMQVDLAEVLVRIVNPSHRICVCCPVFLLHCASSLSQPPTMMPAAYFDVRRFVAFDGTILDWWGVST